MSGVGNWRIDTDDMAVTPTERCGECGEPAAWGVNFTEYDGLRNPPYAFETRYFCEEHLPDEARRLVPDWAKPTLVRSLPEA